MSLDLQQIKVAAKNAVTRMGLWTILTIGLVGWIWYNDPRPLETLKFKLVLVTIAALAAYWVDKSLFSRMSDRINKDMPRDMVSAARVIARALVFLGVALAFSLGI